MPSLKYNSVHYTKYLNNCDLNYKYFLKSIKETPSISKIVLELPTNKLPNIDITEDDYQTKTLLKCFLTFYFINFKVPYINCNKFKNLNTVVGTTNSFHYAYLQTFNNVFDNYKMLLLLLNENDSESLNIIPLTKLNTSLGANTPNNLLNFRLEILGFRVIEYRDILNMIFTRSELQKLKLKLNIVFKNFNNKMVSAAEFRNFFYIWNI